jgi:hypothetical protein
MTWSANKRAAAIVYLRRVGAFTAVGESGWRERLHNVLWTGSHRGPERKVGGWGGLLALLAGFAPRVALALVWIFTNWVDRAFNGFLIPLLGLIVFPYATCSTSLPTTR